MEKRETNLLLRLKLSERQLLEAAANRRAQTVSAFIRGAAVRASKLTLKGSPELAGILASVQAQRDPMLAKMEAALIERRGKRT